VEIFKLVNIRNSVGELGISRWEMELSSVRWVACSARPIVCNV
jgi:hypothetical protein